jgi:tRNA threonylcarbamoyladenosine biosynthesis protein TsaB
MLGSSVETPGSWFREGLVLSLDSSLGPGSVALARGGAICGVRRAEGEGKGKLATLVDELLREVGVTIAEVDAFVVGVGPGRFTGVRSAVAVAKGLAFATEKPLVAVGSLDALGARSEDVVVLGDGPRALYVDGLASASTGAAQAMDLQEFVRSIGTTDRIPARVVGAALGPLREALREAAVELVLEELVLDAALHLDAAWRLGEATHVHDVEPRYVREASITPPKVAPPILPFASR